VTTFGVQWDRDHGVDHRRGWTIVWDGSVLAALEPWLIVALVKVFRSWWQWRGCTVAATPEATPPGTRPKRRIMEPNAFVIRCKPDSLTFRAYPCASQAVLDLAEADRRRGQRPRHRIVIMCDTCGRWHVHEVPPPPRRRRSRRR
jgi:hypothetical protein